MPGAPLVSTAELARSRSNGARWRVIDCRHDLARPDLGEQQFREAHIPGARFAHLERDLSAPTTGRNGRHPLPDPDAFVAWLGRRGLKPTDPIVCYDAGSGAMAARLWWMLRWAGHDAAAVLDGGFAKWLAEGRLITDEVQYFAQSSYPENFKNVAVNVEFVQSHGKNLLLLDARAPARFRGEQEPIDPVAGRIPGAKNRFNNDNLAPSGIFKTPELLRSEFESILSNRDPKEVVHYCGSGVAACHNALAMEICGLSGSRLYPGSWSEWIADPARPRAKG